MCGLHGMSNHEQPRATYASRFSSPPLLRRHGYFTPFVDVHSRSGEQVSGTIILSDATMGEGE
jgi:hypothetical protein